jgi:hypothetical protein
MGKLWNNDVKSTSFSTMVDHASDMFHKVVPPFSIAKLVQISPITMGFVGDISIVNGVYKPSYNWGAPLCRNIPLNIT